MNLGIGDETTAQNLSNEPKMKAIGENLTSVESVESLVTKKWLLQKSDSKVVLMSSESKNTLKWLRL